jgi:hypothetical protein
MRHVGYLVRIRKCQLFHLFCTVERVFILFLKQKFLMISAILPILLSRESIIFCFFPGGQTQFPEGLQGNEVHSVFCKILRGSIPVGTAMKLLMDINQFYPLVVIVF